VSSYHAERLTVAWLRSVSRAADDSSVDQMVGSDDAAGRIGEKEGDESGYFSRLGDSTVRMPIICGTCARRSA
jgi:hypothetical protein